MVVHYFELEVTEPPPTSYAPSGNSGILRRTSSSFASSSQQQRKERREIIATSNSTAAPVDSRGVTIIAVLIRIMRILKIKSFNPLSNFGSGERDPIPFTELKIRI